MCIRDSRQYLGHNTINILKPGTKEDVDHYEYRNGSWSGPSAVKITGSGNMEDNLIALQALNMDKIPEKMCIRDRVLQYDRHIINRRDKS